MSSFLGVCVAILGVCIAWAQWYTARQKLALDLFERRYAAYTAVRDQIIKHGAALEPSSEEIREFRVSVREMAFLFGDEVTSVLDRASTGLKMWRKADIRYRRAREEEREVDANEEWDKSMLYLQHFDAAADNLDRLMKPYLRMDQKLPSAPHEWPRLVSSSLKHRWANRPTGE